VQSYDLDNWALRETLTEFKFYYDKTNRAKMLKKDPGYKLPDKFCTDCTKPIITPAETAVRVEG